MRRLRRRRLLPRPPDPPPGMMFGRLPGQFIPITFMEWRCRRDMNGVDDATPEERRAMWEEP